MLVITNCASKGFQQRIPQLSRISSQTLGFRHLYLKWLEQVSWPFRWSIITAVGMQRDALQKQALIPNKMSPRMLILPSWFYRSGDGCYACFWLNNRRYLGIFWYLEFCSHRCTRSCRVCNSGAASTPPRWFLPGKLCFDLSDNTFCAPFLASFLCWPAWYSCHSGRTWHIISRNTRKLFIST